jgi:hypothetical protein
MVSVSQAIFPVTRPAVQPVFEEQFPERSYFNCVRLAREADPAPFGVDALIARYPYNNPVHVRGIFAQAATAGYLEESAAGQYRIGEQGKAAVDLLNDVFYQRLGEISVLTDEEMSNLVDLLERLVRATATYPAPRKSNFEGSHGSALPRHYGPLAKVDLALDDLNAFRDDAHISAWAGESVDGRSWEALTLVWRGDAHSATELVEALPFRGYTAADYERSLSELTARGWLVRTDDQYRVSERGRAVREVAEETTDEVFYAPWKALEVRELTLLHALLVRLEAGLVELAEPEGSPV